jgi:hypothetical protein
MQLHEVRNRVRAHLFHDLGAMDYDGALAQVQIDGDHFIRRSIHDQIHHLSFARGEGFEPVQNFGAARHRVAILGIFASGRD